MVHRVRHCHALCIGLFNPNYQEKMGLFSRTLQAERNFVSYKQSKKVISGKYLDKARISSQFLAGALQQLSNR